jgi:hypothetical protein
MFGLYDGHGDKEVATFLQDHVLAMLSNHPQFLINMDQAIH